MPEKPQNLWQELKRRKVIRVIIGYAAAAYVLLELTSIIAEPLGLPVWTINFVLILLCIGFVITVVVSWIYDFTPKGIEKTKPAKVAREQEIITKPAKRQLKVSDIIISVLLVAVIVLVYPKIFKKDRLEQLRSEEEITVAVMPFLNMTSDTTWNIWQDGIKDELITHLTNSEEFKVRPTESINNLIQSKGLTNYASITPSIANEISRDLDADISISGSIKQAGNRIRVNAQISDSKTEESLKSFTIDEQYNEDRIFNIIDSLSVLVNNYLIVSVMDKELSQNIRNFSSPGSPEAYRKYILGLKAGQKGDWPTSREYYLDALKIDSNFTEAGGVLFWAYFNNGEYDQAKKMCLNLYAKRNQMTTREEAVINFKYAWCFETPLEIRMAVRQLIEINDQSPKAYRLLGQSYNLLYEYEKAIPEFEKGLDIWKKWDSKSNNYLDYVLLGEAYHETGQHRKERKLYRKVEKDFPGNRILLQRQAILALSTGKTKAAEEYIEKYISSLKEQSYSEATIENSLGAIHRNAGLDDKAEEYHRRALSLEPGSVSRLYSLAWFLIDTERNITEGLELIEKALELSPDNYEFLDTKGWGLYKQGKYQEAYDILQKSWDLRMENAVYSHGPFLRLDAAKKAVAEQSVKMP